MACRQLIFQISCGTGHACPRHASPGGKLTPARPVPASARPQAAKNTVNRARTASPSLLAPRHAAQASTHHHHARPPPCTATATATRQRSAAGSASPCHSWRCDTGKSSGASAHHHHHGHHGQHHGQRSPPPPPPPRPLRGRAGKKGPKKHAQGLQQPESPPNKIGRDNECLS